MNELLEIIKSSGLVPVFNHDDPVTAKRVIRACYDAGLRVFEWTNRGDQAMLIFSRIIHYVKDEMPEMIVGVGSVFNGGTARDYVLLGAMFIVSPVLDPGLSETCKELDVLWIPGAGTATEIYQARKWGASIIKIFPGDAVGGPAFVKAILGPMPDVQLMPTGGVSPTRENLAGWFNAGVCCVGIGSKLFTRELVEDEDSTKLIESIRGALEIIGEIRRGS